MKPFIEEGKLKYLQTIYLSNNKIRKLSALKSPRLRLLDVSNNEINEINDSFDGNPGLKELNLSKNRITKLTHLNNLPKLENLNVSENALEHFGHENSLEGLIKLSKLNLSKNPINKISDEFLPLLESLTELDFKSTKFEKPEELCLLNNQEKFPLLTNLNILDTELVNILAEQAKLEILIICPKLSILNTEEISTEDRQDAYNLAEKKA